MKHTLLAALMCAAAGLAQATTSVSTVGLVTTYTDNFNDAPSLFTIVGGGSNGVVNSGSDDYLLLLNLGTASFTFTAPSPLASLTVSFFFTQNDTGAKVSLASTTINLPDTTPATTTLGSGQFAISNPGGSDPYDAFNTALSFTNLAAGSYTLTFAAGTSTANLTGVKIDDVTIVATAAPVPEPQTAALLLAGLGAAGLLARRRLPHQAR